MKNVYIINESTLKEKRRDGETNESESDRDDMARKSNYDGLKSEDFLGTFVDRKCSKCGHDGMTFSTRHKICF